MEALLVDRKGHDRLVRQAETRLALTDTRPPHSPASHAHVYEDFLRPEFIDLQVPTISLTFDYVKPHLTHLESTANSEKG